MSEINKLAIQLDELLKETNIEEVTSESNDSFEELPAGYYLCEVEKAELKETKETHLPMASFTFKVIEPGKQVIIEEGESNFQEVKNSINRKIFINYVLKDSTTIKRFVSDMLKFEGEEEGQPLLNKEYFLNSEILVDALSILEGMRIYVHISLNTKSDGSIGRWNNLISWKRAKILELI